MPMYEYRCTACGHTFEKIQSFSAPDVKECPKCGSPVERLISAPALQFKGSGFYLTDYGKAGSRDSKDSGSKESGGKDSAGAETKGSGKSGDSGGSSAPGAGAGSRAGGSSPPATSASPKPASGGSGGGGTSS